MTITNWQDTMGEGECIMQPKQHPSAQALKDKDRDSKVGILSGVRYVHWCMTFACYYTHNYNKQQLQLQLYDLSRSDNSGLYICNCGQAISCCKQMLAGLQLCTEVCRIFAIATLQGSDCSFWMHCVGNIHYGVQFTLQAITYHNYNFQLGYLHIAKIFQNSGFLALIFCRVSQRCEGGVSVRLVAEV